MEEYKRKIIFGNAIDLIPVEEKHLDFICDEETNEKLWIYEESIESNKEFVYKKFKNQMNCDWRYDFIIKSKVDDTLYGACYIWKVDDNRKIWEIGYVVLLEYQRRGYCVEAVCNLLKFAFNELGAHKVIGMCNSENYGSALVMEKSGMSKDGVFRKEYLCNGKWVDQFYYSILQEEIGLVTKVKKTI